jgi:hypothetical protein
MTTGLKESKGWTPERRAVQSARIRAAKPWLRSTGPRSFSGKRRCRMNGLKHGHRSRKMQTLLKLLAAQKTFVSRWLSGTYHPAKRRRCLFMSCISRHPSLLPPPLQGRGRM